MTNPKISIIIPTSGNNPLLKKCLRSIKNSDYPKRKIQTIVITNQDLKTAGKEFSFAASVNQAAQQAKGEYLLITNDDITFDPHAIKSWIKAATKKPNTILGANLLSKEETPAPAGYNMSLWTGIAKPIYVNNSPTPCDWISACSLFIKRDIFNNLKGFDETFAPGYFEDADLCFRAKKLGKNCFLIPKVKAFHAQTTTFNKNKPKKYEYWYRNKILFLREHASPLQLVSNLILQYALFTPARAILKKDGRFKHAVKGLIWNLKYEKPKK